MYDSATREEIFSNCQPAIQLINRMRRELRMVEDEKIQTEEDLRKRIERIVSRSRNKEYAAIEALDYIEAFYRTKYNEELNRKPFTEKDVDTLQRQLQEAFKGVEAFVFLRIASLLSEAEQFLEVYDGLQWWAVQLMEKILEYAEKRPEHLKLSEHADVEARMRKSINEIFEIVFPSKDEGAENEN